MADLNAKIIPLQTEVEGRVPTDAQLDVAEIAINLTDKKIFSKNSAGEIVILGAGADEDTSGLPGGGFEPNYTYPGSPFGRWVFRGTQVLNNMCTRPGDAVSSSNLIQVAKIDADGKDVSAELESLDIDLGSYWVSIDGVQTLVNPGAGSRAWVAGDCRYYFSDAGLDLTGATEIEIYAQGVAPADPVPVDLQDGDILRYDGTNWRPSQNTVENLENVTGTAADGHVLQYDGTSWQAQALDYSIDSANDFNLRIDAGSGNPIPKTTGDALVWDGSSWVPANVAAFLSISDLSDVNTVTTAPTDGQALIWDEANGYWRPGSVAVDQEDPALSDLTDTTITTPTTGQFLRYNGSGWVNAVVDYSDLANVPAIPDVLGDLSNVDMSVAPITGQVLTYNGTAWIPDNPSGGGGTGDTVAGALTKRAESIASISLASGGTGDIEFTGMGESGKFVQVTVSRPAWVRFYGTAADRTADALRPVDQDPAPGSGVLLEVRTTSDNELVKITPGAVYWNNELVPGQSLYARITNESGGSALIETTVRAYTSTATDAIVGGTFGSG